MIDWQSYGPIYTVAPGIKKIGELPIIEFDEEENRYLNLKRKAKENIYFDEMYTSDHDQICLLYTSPSPRDVEESRMPSSA